LVSSGSGSDPHLLALLRAIRLRQAAPDAAAAGAADASAALSGHPLPGHPLPGHALSGTDTAASPPAQPVPPALPSEPVPPAFPSEPAPPALPPGLFRPGLPSAPAHPALEQSAAPASGSEPVAPANADPFAQAFEAAQSQLGAGEPPELPGSHPAGHAFGPPVTAVPANDAPAAEPGADPLHVTGYHAGVGPVPSAPRSPAPGPGGTTPATGRTGPIGIPAGMSIPALRGIQPTAVPAHGPTTTPQAGSPTGRSGTPAGPDRPTSPGGPASPPGPASPNAPAGELPSPPAPGRLTSPGVPARTGPPGAPPAVPVPPAPAHPAQASVSPVPGSLPPGRPVPGSYPEPPNPARLAAALRPLLPQAPAAPTRPGTPVDGVNPADDAALREIQRLLGNSLSLAGGPDEVAGRLRAALVRGQPQLLAALPGDAGAHAEQLAQALTWLVHNVDQPPVLAAGCGRLGAVLAECGIQPQQLQLVGAALAEAMRAGMAAGGWRQDFDQAWRTTWQHAYEWIVHGEAQSRYQPTIWTAVVVGHERRRDDLAVIRFRPYLPMPFRPGQYARIEVGELPGVWRPYSLAGAPRRDTVIELHVRAKTEAGVSGTLVYRTKVGDTVRLARAEGEMGLHQAPGRDLLMIAGDTGVAPLKALLTELAATGDPRSVVLFWGVRDLDELYDIEEISAIARAARRATVVPVISEGEAGPYASGLVTDAVAAYGEWSGHEVYLAGPPTMLAATSAALRRLGVDPGRIHHDAPEG
jgi:NAD(P)H-flavin reductase/hemoglobin-like flavoprotein